MTQPALDQDEQMAARSGGTPPAAPEPAQAPPAQPAPRTRRRRSYGQADDIIGAIRLALEGTDNQETKVKMIEALVAKAPPTPSDSTKPVNLFLETFRELGGKFVVNG